MKCSIEPTAPTLTRRLDSGPSPEVTGVKPTYRLLARLDPDGFLADGDGVDCGTDIDERYDTTGDGIDSSDRSGLIRRNPHRATSKRDTKRLRIDAVQLDADVLPFQRARIDPVEALAEACHPHGARAQVVTR